MLRYCFAVLLLCISSVSYSAIDTYEFSDEANRARFQVLAAELRCPKCQNQNIADSNSPIAEDLRFELHRMLETGADDDQIVDFMVTRYGEFVLYRPRMSAQTYLLWYGPAALLILGIVVVLVVSGKRKSGNKKDSATGLSEQEKQRLDHLLKQDQDK
ncbi:cytochrome c-type biogenesis protein [Amphritea balenae]|uniref:Cytochrome c-type biogenesis protein n=1 Tax=Amphritea balenae TaxID=452629 RepID=A0A3P1SQF1_9GAMM|nr:cytochrome c-type biogenesis protein [Amphritea balenae]RRC99204.1 cytochrome c-type biogenesis protein CcmH [Amphritea balenae]GGK73091.1 cytochrome c biogenesis protein [Amphritea balenae]